MQGIIKIGIMIMIFIGMIILWWLRSKLTLNDKNCTAMNKLWSNFPLIRTINFYNDDFSYLLRDYYIKTAYNCCSAGQYKNDFVNVCALKDCIKQGVRCLDFAIYSVNGVPVVAISTLDDFSVKESYNSLPVEDAFKVIRDYAFAGSTCPNPGDPLILHFRILSNNTGICNMLANALYNQLQSRLLAKKYSYEFNGKSLGAKKLTRFMGKIIIIVDKSNPIFVGTKLEEYVNIASNSVFMRSLRYNDVRYTSDMNELMYYNQKNLSICLPNLAPNADNPSAMLPMTYGIQMAAMSFQRFDGNLEYYIKQFDQAGTAFILKPVHLRYVPATIDKALDPPKEQSYEIRDFLPFPGAPDSLSKEI